MSSPDESPQDDAGFVGSIQPVEDRRRRFAILSREDSLKGSVILLAVGVILLLLAAYGLGRGTSVRDMLISVGLATAFALPIDLTGLFITASVLGMGFGRFRSALVRLAAIIVTLQGLGWMLFLGYSMTESVFLLVGGGSLMLVLAFTLMMGFFDLAIVETSICLIILGATESAAAALVDWLHASGVIRLGGASDPVTAFLLNLAQQLPC